MIFRHLVVCSVVLGLCSPLIAQWGAERGPNGPEGGTVFSPVMDPEGDAIAALNEPPPLLDIDTLDMRYSATDLNFSMTFFSSILPPSSGSFDALVGAIDLDVDQDMSTGVPPLQNAFSPPFAMLGGGVEYIVDLFSEATQPGFVNVTDTAGVVQGVIPVAYTNNSISGSIPLSILGNDDGQLNFSGIIGTLAQPTDAMDVVGTSIAVPEPGSLAMMLVLMCGLVCLRRR